MTCGIRPDQIKAPAECIGFIPAETDTKSVDHKAANEAEKNRKAADIIGTFIQDRYADRCSWNSPQADCPKSAPFQEDLSEYTLVTPKKGEDRIVLVKNECLNFTPANSPERGEFTMCEAPKIQRQITIFANGTVIQTATCHLDVVKFKNTEHFGYTPVEGKKWLQEDTRYHAKETTRNNATCEITDTEYPFQQAISPIDAGVIFMALGLELQDIGFQIKHRPLAKQLSEEIRKVQEAK